MCLWVFNICFSVILIETLAKPGRTVAELNQLFVIIEDRATANDPKQPVAGPGPNLFSI